MHQEDLERLSCQWPFNFVPGGWGGGGVWMLCSHSENDVPPEPQWNVTMAGVQGDVRPSIGV